MSYVPPKTKKNWFRRAHLFWSYKLWGEHMHAYQKQPGLFITDVNCVKAQIIQMREAAVSFQTFCYNPIEPHALVTFYFSFLVPGPGIIWQQAQAMEDAAFKKVVSPQETQSCLHCNSLWGCNPVRVCNPARAHLAVSPRDRLVISPK